METVDFVLDNNVELLIQILIDGLIKFLWCGPVELELTADTGVQSFIYIFLGFLQQC